MKPDKYIFSILGGDKRQAVIAEALLKCGHEVKCFGLSEYGSEISGAELFSSYEKAIAGSDVVLLPLPVSRDQVTLAFQDSHILLTDILKYAEKSNCKVILGGMLPKDFIHLGSELGIKIIDYYSSENLQRKNALPSAEGSLMLAMEQTNITVAGMDVLISGYGRIGRCLAHILQRLGANVTVAVRRDESLNEVAMCGYQGVNIFDKDELNIAFGKSDVVFNTVPAHIFNKGILTVNGKKPLYIEIASAPYGIDLSDAHDCDIRVLFAPSLPGKYAPISAGKYIFETISDILAEVGMNIFETEFGEKL